MSEQKKISGECEHNWDKAVYTSNSSGPELVCTICGERKPLKT